MKYFEKVFDEVLHESTKFSKYEDLMKKYNLNGDVIFHKDSKFHNRIESFQNGDMVNGYMVNGVGYARKDEHEKNDNEDENFWQGTLIDATGKDTWCEIAYKKGSDNIGRYYGPWLCSLQQAEKNIILYKKVNHIK